MRFNNLSASALSRMHRHGVLLRVEQLLIFHCVTELFAGFRQRDGTTPSHKALLSKGTLGVKFCWSVSLHAKSLVWQAFNRPGGRDCAALFIRRCPEDTGHG